MWNPEAMRLDDIPIDEQGDGDISLCRSIFDAACPSCLV
jgi:hypothetical protein